MGVLKVKDAAGNWVPVGVGIFVAGPWTPLTLLNAWQNYGGGGAPLAWRSFGDMVQVRGVLKSGVNNTAVAQLPVGSRPPWNLHMNPAMANFGPVGVDVGGDGMITAYWTGSPPLYMGLYLAFSTVA